jgi:hypothetical protein
MSYWRIWKDYYILPIVEKVKAVASSYTQELGEIKEGDKDNNKDKFIASPLACPFAVESVSVLIICF